MYKKRLCYILYYSTTTVLTVASFSSSTIILEGSSSTRLVVVLVAALHKLHYGVFERALLLLLPHIARGLLMLFAPTFLQEEEEEEAECLREREEENILFCTGSSHTLLRENGLAKQSKQADMSNTVLRRKLRKLL